MMIRRALLIACAAGLVISHAQAQPKSPPPTAQPAAYTTQGVYFARSGQTVRVELTPIMGASMGQAVLRAFGRVWTDPVNSRREGIKLVADINAPAVRVPTRFAIVPPGPNNSSMGELVVYPQRDVKWDPKIRLFSAGEPAWFGQWAHAVGLPVVRLAENAKIPDDLPRPADDQRALLVLGRSRAGKDPLALAATLGERKCNLMVLDADWFGEAGGAVGVAPAQMRGGLAEMAGQHWPQPLAFTSHRGPWPGVINRWAWIMDEGGLPLVEQISSLSAPDGTWAYDTGPVPDTFRPVVLSYLPWEQQLGGSESADAALPAMLAAAAMAVPQAVEGHPLEFVHPAQERLDPALRPVLCAARSVRPVPQPDRKPHYNPPIWVILDLRGKDRPPEGETLARRCKQLLDGQPVVRLLILGDDKLLDEWEWIKLDRAKKRVGHGAVVWIPDDELPPSVDNQIRLMLTLTEWGVPLVRPQHEENLK